MQSSTLLDKEERTTQCPGGQVLFERSRPIVISLGDEPRVYLVQSSLLKTCEKGGPHDYPRQRQFDLSAHAFNGPPLHSENLDHAQYYGSQEAAEAHAEELISLAISAPHHDKFEPGESDKIVRGCRIDPVRKAIFNFLRAPEVNREHRHTAALKFIGACSFAMQGKLALLVQKCLLY